MIASRVWAEAAGNTEWESNRSVPCNIISPVMVLEDQSFHFWKSVYILCKNLVINGDLYCFSLTHESKYGPVSVINKPLTA